MNPFRQAVKYWPPGPAGDGYGGQSFGGGQNIFGRWEDVQEQFMDAKDELALSKAHVFFPAGPNDIPILVGGYLYLGVPTDEGSDPTVIQGAFVIRQVAITPSIRLVRNEMKAIL